MPRLPRIQIEGVIYHVISRGVKQSPIFIQNRDRWDFFRLLKLTQKDHPFILHAYCLMDNHYHLLMQPLTASLSKIMHAINSVYANRYNIRNHLTGHVLQGRFHSIPVETDSYLTTVSRYIHLNPFRAGIVQQPENYRWSNYRSVIEGLEHPLADPSFVLGYFGKEAEQQRLRYKRFVEDAMTRPELITDKVIWRMRQWGNPLGQFPDTADTLRDLSQIMA